MKIAVDLRCLLPRNYSGVGWYTINLLKSLFKLDQKNQYILFFNQFKNLRKDLPTFDFPNVKQIVSHIPNKFLTLSGRFLDFPKIDHLIPDRIDVFFIPLLKVSPVSSNCKKVITCHDYLSNIFLSFFLSKIEFLINSALNLRQKIATILLRFHILHLKT